MVVEGPIDSMFLQNSLATLGLKGSKETTDFLQSLDSYYIFDCDKPGFEEAAKYIADGYSVFNWELFLKDHNVKLPPGGKLDINDVYIKLKRKSKFTFEELEKYFTNSYYDRIHFL